MNPMDFPDQGYVKPKRDYVKEAITISQGIATKLQDIFYSQSIYNWVVVGFIIITAIKKETSLYWNISLIILILSFVVKEIFPPEVIKRLARRKRNGNNVKRSR